MDHRLQSFAKQSTQLRTSNSVNGEGMQNMASAESGTLYVSLAQRFRSSHRLHGCGIVLLETYTKDVVGQILSLYQVLHHIHSMRSLMNKRCFVRRRQG